MTKSILFLLASSIFFSVSSYAEDFPGGSSKEEFEKAFAEDKGISASDTSNSEKDRLSIGGSVQAEYTDAVNEGSNDYGSENEDKFTNPYTLYLYFDGRLRHDIRGFATMKTVYDPSYNDANDDSGDDSATTEQTRVKPDHIVSTFDELKLMFNVKKRVYLTLGKQKIKWGAAKFWNPTDLINSSKRDFLKSEDERAGVPLAKIHIPISDANFYAIGLFDHADKTSQIGYAGRFEIPLKSSEFSLSALGHKNKKTLYAADFSAGIGDFDVYGETVFSKGSNTVKYRALSSWPVTSVPSTSATTASFEPCIPNSNYPYLVPCEAYTEDDKTITKYTAGISYEHSYLDKDTFTIFLEYFHNDEGYEDEKDYLIVLQNNAYQPFYLGTRYGMVSFYIPSPGDLNDWTFTVFNICNLDDGTYLSRLHTSVIAMQDLTVTGAIGHYYGNPDGELRLGGRKWDYSLSLKIVF